MVGISLFINGCFGDFLEVALCKMIIQCGHAAMVGRFELLKRRVNVLCFKNLQNGK